MQAAGVQACAKHFSKSVSHISRPSNIVLVGNEQEKNRDTINSQIDDRVNHEVGLSSLHRDQILT